MSVNRNLNLGPSHIKAKRRRLFYIRCSIILFLLFFLIFTIAIISGHDKIIIKEINVSGNAAVSTDSILAVVNKSLTGRYYYLFAKNNFLIFPRFKIKEDLFREIKTLKEINISWQDWQKISIDIIERKPHTTWCGIAPEIAIEPCYFIDKTGYLYSTAPNFSGNLFIRNYGQISTSTGPVGQYFLYPNQYALIYNLIDILNENNLKVSAVYLDGQVFNFYLENGPKIIFNTTSNLNLVFGNLFSALESGEVNLIDGGKTIKYIDLRFPDKVIIGKKEKNAD